jgi:hypothetical protein
LNADNVPRPDFLRRLLPHYQNGADYVIVRSVVLNSENFWGKLIWAAGMARLSTNPTMEWSEGFSCRRVAAETVGYIPGDFPVPFCRDWRFGAALNQAGFKKYVDLSIAMEHICPSTLRAFWRNQVWRGSMSAPTTFYFRHLSMPLIALREILRAAKTLLGILLVVPVLLQSVRYSTYTPGRWRNVPGLFIAQVIQSLAQTVGSCKGLGRLIQVEGWRRHPSLIQRGLDRTEA